MSVTELIVRLTRLGIRLELEGERLVVSAPPGIVTPALAAEMKAQRAEIHAWLAQHRDSPAQPRLERSERPARLPLSPAQRRLWFLDRLREGKTPEFNLPEALRLRGRLDVAALEQALTIQSARHESLRTRFLEQDGTPYQVIDPPQPLILPVEDLSDYAAEFRETAVREALAAEWRQPFALSTGPLSRVRLLRLGPDHHVLLRTCHHIISDGWSAGILHRELAALYRAFTRGEANPLPALSLDYADYAVWQNRLEQEGALAADLAYWQQHLAGSPEALSLPTDRPRPPVPDFTAGSLRLRLERAQLDRLTTMARERGATLHMALLAGLALVLGRHAGQEDLVIGTPVAGRTEAALEPLVGFFVNSLCLRLRPRVGLTGGEMLAQTRTVALEAQAHQRVPFERLVEELAPNRDLARPPLFQVSLALANTPTEAVDLDGLEIAPLAEGEPLARYDLSVHAQERTDGLEILWLYPRSLFEPERMAAIAADFIAVLAQMAERPDTRPDPLFSAPERTLAGIFHRRPPEPTTATDLFRAAFARDPAAPALLTSGRPPLSYGALEAWTDRLAHGLAAGGAEPEQRVALCLSDPFEIVIGMIATLKSGAAFTVISPDDPPETQARLLRQCAPVMALADAATPLPDGFAHSTLTNLAETSPAEPFRPNRPLLADHPAYLVFTSGSSGARKGVVVSHRALVSYLRWFAGLEGVGPGRRSALVTSAAYDLGYSTLFGALMLGGAVLLPTETERRSSQTLWEMLARFEIDWLKATPSWLAMMMADPDAGRLGRRVRLRMAMFGGEPQSFADVRRLRRLMPGITVLSSYGPTETTISCHSGRIDPAADAGAPQNLGQTIDGVQAFVLDSALRPVPLGAVGEVWIAGPGLARGYHNAPALTAERFVACPFGAPGERMYRSGDRVRRNRDGSLDFLGRIDEQLKLNGFRVEPGEVEAALQHLPQVARACAGGLEFGGGRRLVAWVVPVTAPADPAAFAGQLRAELAAELPAPLVPAAIEIVESLPLTANGKVDRSRLPQPALGGSPTTARPPASEAERVLCRLFAELTGVASVSVEDNFFALGGHSLLAMRLVAQIRAALGLEPPLRAVFEAPTPATLAARLGLDRIAGPARPPLTAQPHGPRAPTSHAQQRLWVIDQMEGSSVEYNMPEALLLTGPLNQPALERTLARMVERHETLRTRFVVENGVPVQEILPPIAVPLPLTDWSDRSEVERQAKLEEAVAAEWHHPFDLATGPLFRARLLRLEAETHVLLRTCHHIISDGWSAGVINRELAALYEAFAAGLDDPLPPLPVHYADFAVWQSDWLESGALDQGLVWWREALAGRPERLTLPTDRPRPPLQTYGAEVARGRLDAETTAAARALAASHGATLFQVMLAAFALVLSRDARQDDIVIGTVVANRQDPQLDGLIGFFVNALAMRVRIEPGDDFAALVARTRDHALAAYQHQDVPFEKLVEDLAPERSLAYTPIFQIMFNLQNVRRGHQVLRDLEIDSLPGRDLQVRFDLESHAVERGAEIDFFWLYNRDLFEADRIDSMLARFLAVLTEGVRAPSTPLPLLARARTLPVAPSKNHPVPPGTLSDFFAPIAAAHADRPALIHGDRVLTYREADLHSNRLAHWLITQGAGPERVVGINLKRGIEAILAILATLKAGAAYLPLDPDLPAARRAAMEEDARPVVVLTAECLADIALDSFPATRPDSGAQPDNPAYLIFTSGSTGRPKGVITRHPGVIALAEDQIAALKVGPDSRVLHFAALSFDVSVMEIIMAFGSGAALVIADEDHRAGPALLDLLRDQSVTHAVIPPALLAVLPVPANLPLRWLVSGGEVVPLDVAERWAEGRNMLNGYGPTEVSVIVTESRPLSPSEAWTIGRPIASGRIYLLDPSLAPVPVGMPGELWIGGEGLARGYVGRPGLTAERFVADPYGPPGARMYRTGDLAAWRRDGALDFLGRVDHQIKVRGFRIEPGEIEAALRRHPRVKDALALKLGEGAEAHLVGYIVPDETPSAATEADRAAHVAHWQSLYESTYGESPGGDFDISGWNASDDGAPIPAAEMMSWVRHTVDRIAALPGADVLEIGCGSGLLLTRIAPDRRSYLGLDFSAAALERLRATVAARPDLAGKVTLRQGEACDLSPLADASVDLVVINSVVQYFPDLDYLLAVIREGLRVCRPGGHLFLGDLRSLVLLPALHSWVTLQRADPAAPAAPLAGQIAQAVADEEELTLDPALFEALADLYPGLSRVELAPKLGGYDNELSRYRYDVILALGPVRQSLVEPEIRIAANPDWPQRLVAAGPAAPVAVEGGPDPRGAWTRIAADLCPGFPGSVAALRAEAEARAAAEAGLTADLLAAAGGPIVWRGVGTGRLEAIYHPRWVERARPAETPDLTLYANQPARRMGQSDLGREVQDHLRTLLPEHMIPAPILVVPHFPLTASGKIDRKALPTPDACAGTTPPANADEATLCALFARTLNRPDLGAEDDFFTLGGHSLLALRLVSEIRDSTGIDLPTGVLWQFPSPRALAPWLTAFRTLYLSPRQRRCTQFGAEKPLKLFLLPPALGFSVAYAGLAKLLPEMTLYSFAAPDSLQTLLGDVDVICEIQPEGPIHLMGHSSGSYLAFLAARALEARGREVAEIIAFDSYWSSLPSATTPDQEIRDNVDLFVARAGREGIRAIFDSSRHFREKAYNQTIRYFRFLMSPDLDQDRPVKTRTHLVLAEGHYDRQEDWSVRCLGGCIVHRGQGEHAFMVDPPYVVANAALIRSILTGPNQD